MTGRTPLVSVIMPTFNREDYLPTAITSVLAQTFGDFELIIVDDGSEDNTAQIVRAFDDRKIRYIKNHHNGISHSLNTGIEAAKGQFIARLDSDDIWLPDMLGSLISELQSNPGAGLAYGMAQGMDADGNLLYDRRGKKLTLPGSAYHSMLIEDHICNIALVVRRECFATCGWFDETMTISEDWDMYLRIAKKYPFIYHNRVLARYRYHENNITRFNPISFKHILKTRLDILDREFSGSEMDGQMITLKPTAYANIYQWAAQTWLHHGEISNALWAQIEAITHSKTRVRTTYKCIRQLSKFKLNRHS